MMNFLRKLHKWIGLLIGIQVLLWVISGLVMSLLDPAKVSGQQWANNTAKMAQTPLAGNLLEPEQLPLDQLPNTLQLSLEMYRDAPVYRVRHAAGETLINAVDGSVIVISEQDAARQARQDFTGDGEIRNIEAGFAPDLETRSSTGAYWRVNFNDQASTSIYISASSGDILARRNSHWRIFDVFWMLHIMDYSGRQDFNNVLVISVALISFWLGLSGFILLFSSFRRKDFSFFTRNTVSHFLRAIKFNQ